MNRIISKTTQLVSIGKKTSLLVMPVTAILLTAQASGKEQKSPTAKLPDPVALADDDFGKVSEADIKGFFDAEGRDEKFAKDQLSRSDYNSKQKHSFELHKSRTGLGLGYFRTNEGNYGKLLYTWGVGPKLHLKEIVVFDSHPGKAAVRTFKDIVLQSAGHMDLDNGTGTHQGPGSTHREDYSPDIHFSNLDGETMYLSATDGASFLFPIDKGAPDSK